MSIEIHGKFLLGRLFLSSSHNFSYEEKVLSIKNTNALLHLTVLPKRNGEVGVSKTEFQKWEIFSFEELVANSSNLACNQTENDKDIEMFFIKSSKEPCFVLTAMGLGEYPEFKVFDEMNIDYQLWYFKESHLINFGSQFALHIENPGDANGSTLMLWHIYPYAENQTFVMENDHILTRNGECFLTMLEVTGSSPSIVTSCTTRPSQPELEQLVYNEDLKIPGNLVCPFYIQNAEEPCKLLTSIPHHSIQVRPYNKTLMNRQLWYWNGKHLEDLHTGSSLCTQANRIIQCQNETGLNWTFQAHKLHLDGQSLALTIDIEMGSVKLEELSNSLTQKWKLVSIEDIGDLSDCTDRSNPATKGYVIKMEKDECKLLTRGQYRGGFPYSYDLSLEKFNDKDKEFWSRQVWRRPSQNTIKSFSTDHRVSVRYPQYENYCRDRHPWCESIWRSIRSGCDHCEITLQHRYKSGLEAFQEWDMSGGCLISSFNKSFQLTNYFPGSRLTNRFFNSSQKCTQWTWLTLNEIAEDKTKLWCKRCNDKTEQKAADIIGWIPGISTVYNVIRAGVYGGIGCKEMALESLSNAATDLAIDAAIAIGTVLTGGAASAGLIAMKTGLKLGAKAGARVFGKALLAVLKKEAVKSITKSSIRKGIKHLAKYGIKKSVKASGKLVKNSAKKYVRNALRLKNMAKPTADGGAKFLKKSKHFIKSGGLKKYAVTGVKGGRRWMASNRKTISRAGKEALQGLSSPSKFV